MNSGQIDLTVLIPCFNEQEYVEATLDEVLAAVTEARLSYEIILIDDCSSDNTFAVASKWQASHPNALLNIRKNSKNRGLSRTFVDGAFLGKGKYYRLVCGDHTEPKETLLRIFERIGEADIVIPYQPVVPGKPLKRRILSKTYTWLINTITAYNLKYYNGSALHLRYNVMRWGPYSFGFGFQAELITRLLDEGATYLEIPVKATHIEKDARASAINWRNFLSVMHTLMELVVRRIRRETFG